MADTMRAAVFDETGGPEVLHLAEIPIPEPGSGQVLVQVKASAINGFDLMARAGTFKTGQPRPAILGADIAGVVARYGPDCRAEGEPGRPVILHWVLNCWRCESCLRGHPTTCLRYKYLGAHVPGGYAEYVAVPEDNLIPFGDDPDWVRAAAFPMVYGTSWHMLIETAHLRPTETVLIQAAGSGIGMAAVQIARLVGARIIATAGSDAKLDKAVEQGAHEVINYREQDLAAEVKRITGGRGVDVVFEHVGGQMFEQVVRCVTRNGRIVTCGGTAGYDVGMNIAHVFHKQLSILGSNSATRWELAQIAPLVLDGTFEPVVDRVFGLAEAADAHRHLDQRQQFGKVVLDVAI